MAQGRGVRAEEGGQPVVRADHQALGVDDGHGELRGVERGVDVAQLRGGRGRGAGARRRLAARRGSAVTAAGRRPALTLRGRVECGAGLCDCRVSRSFWGSAHRSLPQGSCDVQMWSGEVSHGSVPIIEAAVGPFQRLLRPVDNGWDAHGTRPIVSARVWRRSVGV
ncbi:hypothetical protein GCM10010249_45760 [Streptomyces roseolilacinus]|uniref:Uncharacterized protein n=1 Tax=Streptomyces roseolilacinus TaxID=66904 RepID=A0A918B369_9ACTN|nr:hypothetical protein GCM10010249_45760 [Streptomyces roseolilacinus]